MKPNRFLSFISLYIGFAALFTLSSCGDDDGDNESVEPYRNTKPMRVSKITESHTRYSYNIVYNLVYDNSGNLEKVIYDGTRTGYYTYSYDGNTVTRNLYYDYEGKTSLYKTETFELKNGNVLKIVGWYDPISHSKTTRHYNYDSNGCIIMERRTYSNSEFTNSLTWENGNMTRCVEYYNGSTSRTVNVAYSSIPWPQNLSMYLLVYADSEAEDLFLYPAGIWGNSPKYLPSRYDIYDTSGNLDIYGCAIDYTMKQGLIARMSVSDNDGSAKRFDIEWEEIPDR